MMASVNEIDLELWHDMGFIDDEEYEQRLRNLRATEKKKEDEEAYDRAMQGVG